MNYGKAIRICRAAFDLTQAELAARLKSTRPSAIGASQLSLIESGKRQPSPRTLDDLCTALGVPRSLLILLAYEPGELAREDEEIIGHLSKKLVNLLAEADAQPELPFEKERR